MNTPVAEILEKLLAGMVTCPPAGAEIIAGVFIGVPTAGAMTSYVQPLIEEVEIILWGRRDRHFTLPPCICTTLFVINTLVRWITRIYLPMKVSGVHKMVLYYTLLGKELEFGKHVIGSMVYEGFVKAAMCLHTIGATLHLILLQELAMIDPHVSRPILSPVTKQLVLFSLDYSTTIGNVFSRLWKVRQGYISTISLIPETLPSQLPAASGNTPAASGNTPAASGNTPAASGNTPAAGGNTPAASGNTPAASGNTPAAGGNTPAASGNTPAAGGNTSAAGGNTPAASGNTPAASGNTPAASGNTPAASGNTPAASGSNTNNMYGFKVGWRDNLSGQDFYLRAACNSLAARREVLYHVGSNGNQRYKIYLAQKRIEFDRSLTFPCMAVAKWREVMYTPLGRRARRQRERRNTYTVQGIAEGTSSVRQDSPLVVQDAVSIQSLRESREYYKNLVHSLQKLAVEHRPPNENRPPNTDDSSKKPKTSVATATATLESVPQEDGGAIAKTASHKGRNKNKKSK